MKRFAYDEVLEPENICNLKREISQLKQAIEKNKRVVVYGPRNYGKTSVVQNVIVPRFQKTNKKCFVLFCDLMQVKNLEQIGERMRNAFQSGFSKSFRTQAALTSLLKILAQLRPSLQTDPLTGQFKLSVDFAEQNKQETLQSVLGAIKKLTKKMPCLIVLDEFQDIAKIEQAQALFRQGLQELSRTPIILMGSQQHILADMLVDQNQPLAGFGEDIVFEPIPYDEYHSYIQERFSPRKLKIDFDTSKELQNLLQRNPEAINIVCAQIVADYERCTICHDHVVQAIEFAVAKRQKRFWERIASLKEIEEKMLRVIAVNGSIAHPTSKETVAQAGISVGGAAKAIDSLHNVGFVEKIDNAYRVADPLLKEFILRHR